MRLMSVLATLVVTEYCTAESQQSRTLQGLAFGIVFSMETLQISFVPPGGDAKGLISVEGNEAYQALMYSYFSLCYWAHVEQVPPKMWEDNCTAGYGPYADTSESMLDLVAYRHEAYPDETDVDILASAVKDVKQAATDILAQQYNITMPDRPLVSIAAPNFMWSMTEPDFWFGGFETSHATPYKYNRDDWHHSFARKMNDAVHEAGFRLEPVNVINAAIPQADRKPDLTFPIAPASYAAFQNHNFAVNTNTSVHHPPTSHRTPYEGPPSIVLELTNATLSLWAQRQGQDQIWSPWNTLPQFGAHTQFEDWPGYMYSPEDSVWGDIVSMIRALRDFMASPESEVLRVYLTGDAWDGEMVEAFAVHLRIHRHTGLSLEFRGGFAGSDGAAVITRGMLDAVGAGP